jgi:cytosine/adenosine deaminase-related metal-dependent hydrolase
MSTLIALYDACVLYPALLRDLLMYLARSGLFHPHWTQAIHEEWIRSLLADRPELKRTRLERTRDQMNAAIKDCLVVGYKFLIPTLTLPDADDRHVLAAAIHSKSSMIVTYNLRDFPAQTLKAYKIEAVHPDTFVSRLLDRDAARVVAAVRTQRQNMLNPPYTAEQLLDALERQGLPQTVSRLRPFADQI